MIIRKFLSILIIKSIIKPYIKIILKLKNSSIGNHSIVAPNSAGTKDIPPYTMFGGVPAQFIKSTYDMIFNHT